MIASEVASLSKSFSEEWKKIFQHHARYRLDYTWPSIGTVQLILSPIWEKPELEETDQQVMLGAAAYLADFWHSIVSTYPDNPSIRVDYVDDDPPHIDLIISGGKYLAESERVSMRLMPILWHVARNPFEPYPFFEKTVVQLRPGLQSIPLFMLGLLTGLSPYFDGAFRGKSDSDLADYIMYAEKRLAETCAVYYQAVFPSEPLGQQSGLYTKQYLFPPFGHKQAHLVTRPIFRLLSGELQAELNLKTLLFNLATIPNQSLSLPALFALLAVSEIQDIPKLRPLCQASNGVLARTRAALQFARTAAGKPAIIPSALLGQKIEAAREMIELERGCDLIPWLIVPTEKLLASDMSLLFSHIEGGFWLDAAQECQRARKGDAAFLIQSGLFFLLAAELDKAEEAMNSADQCGVEEAMLPYFRQLKACLEIARTDFALAERILRTGLSESSEFDHNARNILSRQLLGCLIIQQKLESAEEFLEDFYPDQDSGMDFPFLLDAIDIALSMNSLDRADLLARHAVRLAPNDSRAFTAFLGACLREAEAVEALPEPAPKDSNGQPSEADESND